MEPEKLTVYVVFMDMEDDYPSAYCLDEDAAKMLVARNPGAADYIAVEVDPDYWSSML